MTIDIEARVRRANLLTRGHQLEQLFDDELSSRLLRDIYAKKEGRMSDTTDRPQPVTVEETGGYELPAATQPPVRRQGPAWALAAFVGVIAIGVVLALVAREPEPVAGTTPVEIAAAFMAAVNAHDNETVLAMLAEDATHQHETIDILRGELELQRILDRRYEFGTCHDSPPANFSCPYEWSNAVSRAMGAGPYRGVFVLTITDGEISNWDLAEPDALWREEMLPAFASWMEENHPEDDLENLYFHYGGPEDLAFWEQYLPEYLASVEGSG